MVARVLFPVLTWRGKAITPPAPGDHQGPPIGINLSDLTLSSFAALRVSLDGPRDASLRSAWQYRLWS